LLHRIHCSFAFNLLSINPLEVGVEIEVVNSSIKVKESFVLKDGHDMMLALPILLLSSS
jgi:hypothetical protein